MKKEILAIIIIIICLIGSIIGLISNFKNKKVDEYSENSKFDTMGILDYSDKIAIIRLNGVISDEEGETGPGPFQGMTPSSRARKYLTKASKDICVKAVVLRINSPGGTVASSQEMYSAVVKCREKKPVVVSMGDISASGGYYISSAADLIVANPGTLTGSIGVILNGMNFQKLLDKIGISNNIIKSGKLKDIVSPFRQMTPQERALLQKLINNAYGQFIDAIVEGRINYINAKYPDRKLKLTEKILKENADGRIFTGKQALEIGLVDQLGDIEVAKKEALKLAQSRFKNVSDAIPFEFYDKPQTVSDFLMEITNNVKPKASLLDQKLPFSMSHPYQPLWIME